MHVHGLQRKGLCFAVFTNPEGPLSLGVLPVPSFLPLSLLVGGRTGWQDAVGEGPAHVSMFPPSFPGRDYTVSKEDS